MSEYADKHSKSSRKERVDHIIGVDPKGKVDASGYTPPDPLNAEEKVGPKPTKPRAYAKGGKVEGGKAHHHAGRKSRDMGGATAVQQLRPQVPTGGLYGAGFSPTHWGSLANAAGLKKGGEAKKRSCGGKAGERRLEMTKDAAKKRADGGGAVKQTPQGFHATRNDETRHFPSYDEAKRFALREGDRNRLWQIGPKSDDMNAHTRKARAEGGRTKGKTNINIIIGSPKDQQPMVPPPPSAMPPAPPPPRPGLPPAAMGAMSGPPGAMGAPGGPPPGMPPQMPPGMGRG